MSTSCLRSGDELTDTTIDGISFRLSKKTGGIWLDNFVLPKIHEASDSTKEAIAEMMLASSSSEVDLSERVISPVANGMVMVRKPISFCSGLTIDECPVSGGVWIDGQERLDLLQIFQHSETAGRQVKAKLYVNKAPETVEVPKEVNVPETLSYEGQRPVSTVDTQPKEGFLLEAFSVVGRINRWTYIKWRLILLSPLLLLPLLLLGLGHLALSTVEGGLEALPDVVVMFAPTLLIGGVLVYAILFFIIEMFTSIRRLHDLNMSGWYYLGLYVPLFNLYLALIMVFRAGDFQENDYGLPPEPGRFS